MKTHFPSTTRLRTSHGEITTTHITPASKARLSVVFLNGERQTAHSDAIGSTVSRAGLVNSATPPREPKQSQRRMGAYVRPSAKEISDVARRAEKATSHTNPAGQIIKYGTTAHI